MREWDAEAGLFAMSIVETETDKGLLTGLLALQLGFVSRDAAVDAIQCWSHEGHRNLVEVLEERGALTPEQASIVENLANDMAARGSGTFRIATLADFDPEPPSTQEMPALSANGDPLATRVPTRQEAALPRARFHRMHTHAEGGLGVVYVARDGELNREVALKEIKEVWADHDQSRARFLLEAEVTGGLEHPGIVPVYSLGRHADGRPYYAMRFVRGLTLQESIEQYHKMRREGASASQRSLEFQRMLRVFLDVCNTIGYAHSRGVLHRDIKPSNILLGKFGETLVVDWGLAKPFDKEGLEHSGEEQPIRPSAVNDLEHTLAGASIGTPGYMSPEQATGRLEKMGPTSDLYSLGATLYAILTGTPPFSGKELFEILGKMGRGEFARPRQVDSDIPRPLEAICLKAMSMKIVGRYQSAADLATDIEHWLADEPVSALDEDANSRFSRWCRKHRGMVRVLAVALLLMSFLSVAASFVVNTARLRANTERQRAEAITAGLSLDRALGRMERGEGGRGMLRLAQSLSVAPDHATDLKMAIRANLGGWGRYAIPLAQLIPLPGMVHAVAFSDDGRRLITGCRVLGESGPTSQTQVWDVSTGEQVGITIVHEGTVLAIVHGEKGHWSLSGGSTRHAHVMDVEVRHTIGHVIEHPEEIQSGAFAPGGKRMALGGAHGCVRVWNVESATECGPVLQHPGAVLGMAFSPDGSRLLTGCTDGAARLWDFETGKMIGEPLLHSGAVDAVAFRPDGKRIATGGTHGLVRFWDAQTFKPTDHGLRHQGAVYALAYNDAGTRVITGCEDNRARLWDAETGRLLGLPIEMRGSVEAAVFAPDGNSVATGSGDRNARIWDTTDANVVLPARAIHNRVGAIAYLSDDKTVLIGRADGLIERCDAATLHPIGESWNSGVPIKSMAVRPGGGAVVVVGEEGEAVCFDPVLGAKHSSKWLATQKVRAASYSSDGKLLVTGGEDGIARFWDVHAAAPLPLTLDHRWPISVVLVHPNKPIVLTAGGGLARLWNSSTGGILRTFPSADGPIYAAAFSPDGMYVATGGEDDMARVRVVDTGALVSYPHEHNGSVIAVAFSADGRTLATGGNDGKAKFWDVQTSKPLGPEFSHNGRVTALAFDPSGRFVLTGGTDGELHYWPKPIAVPDDVRQITAWVHSITGLELDTDLHRYGVARVLDRKSWNQARELLKSVGGPPYVSAH